MVKPGRKGSSKGPRGAQPSVPKVSKIIGGVEQFIHKRLCEIILTSPRTRPPPPSTPPYDPYVVSSAAPQVGGLQPARRCVYGELPTNTMQTQATFSPFTKSRAASPVGRCSTPFVPSHSASPPSSPKVTPAPRVPRKSTVPANPSPLCRSWVLGKRGLKPPSHRRRAQLNSTVAEPTLVAGDPVQVSPPAYVPVMPSYLPPGTPSTAVEQLSDPSDVAMFDLEDWDIEMVDLNQAKTLCDEETRLPASPQSPLVTPDASNWAQWLPSSPSTSLPPPPPPPPPPPTPRPILEANLPSSCGQEQTTYAPAEPRGFNPDFHAHMGASSSIQQDRTHAIIGQRPQDIQREIRKTQGEVGPMPTGHVEPSPSRSLQSLIIAEVKFHQEPVPTARGNSDTLGFRPHPRPFRSVQPQAYASSSNTASPPLHTPRVHTYTSVLDQDRDAIHRASLKRKAAFDYECDSWQHPLADWIDMSTVGTAIGEGTVAKKRRTCVSEPSDQSNLAGSTSPRAIRPHRTLRRNREERRGSWTNQPDVAPLEPRLTQTLQYANELKRYVRRLVVIPRTRPRPHRTFPQVQDYASSSSSSGSEILSSIPGALLTNYSRDSEEESSNSFLSAAVDACNWLGLTFRRVGQSLLGEFT